MTTQVRTRPPSLMAALGFAVAVCAAVAIAQIGTDQIRVVAGLVYMLAGLVLLIPPGLVQRPRPSSAGPSPRMTLYMPLSGPLSRWEVR